MTTSRAIPQFFLCGCLSLAFVVLVSLFLAAIYQRDALREANETIIVVDGYVVTVSCRPQQGADQ